MNEFMEAIEAITTRRHTGGIPKQAGLDITANVNPRMVLPEARVTLAKGGPVSDQIETAISSRLLVSLRDEAIWPYNIGGSGLVFWSVDRSFHYIGGGELNGNGRFFRLQAKDEIPALFNACDLTQPKRRSGWGDSSASSRTSGVVMKYFSLRVHNEDGGPLRSIVISGKIVRGFGAVDPDRPRTLRWTFVPPTRYWSLFGPSRPLWNQ